MTKNTKLPFCTYRGQMCNDLLISQLVEVHQSKVWDIWVWIGTGNRPLSSASQHMGSDVDVQCTDARNVMWHKSTLAICWRRCGAWRRRH